ncbi:unnamed protein product [Notodromas monacha]|uniref:Uncharacterized protein n=1 Tax=Notodromas monacha TaxID=399045 RepID=A0A7R9G930_9CRUS|nr:unnamed protein product [Notodromas monacha]CAG0913836.1 unnamed protein product [Notodromas monacha]
MFSRKFYVLQLDLTSNPNLRRKVSLLRSEFRGLKCVQVELCYNVALEPESGDSGLCKFDEDKLRWVFSQWGNKVRDESQFVLGEEVSDPWKLIEIGPRLNFTTPFSTNVVSILRAVGVESVSRVELSTRYLLWFESVVEDSMIAEMSEKLHDRMTECVYDENTLSDIGKVVIDKSLERVPLLAEGRAALEKLNKVMGLGFDDWDLSWYTKMFQELGRDPTTVECFDLAQSNSEHSRHWFFKGDLEMNGHHLGQTLFELIMATQEGSNQNNVIKFSDNSSAIEGFVTRMFLPLESGSSAPFLVKDGKRHIVFTAETHNFPTAICPFSGAATGTGGRIRDVQAVGRGGHVIAASAGYCFGNLKFPGEGHRWNTDGPSYPESFATPLEVAIQASNGASDYGNKFGEPVILGFVRSFGLNLIKQTGFHKEWMKPIMFSAGIGTLDEALVSKETPAKGMLVVKVGGLPYRVGVGGGAASSAQVQGSGKADLDFNAVQRGDPEMEQKMNRVIRGCIETGLMKGENPILSIHDQGAGGNGNVLKELVEPAGAVIRAKDFQLGDQTMTPLEIWGAEYQESNALLCSKDGLDVLAGIAAREKCPVDVVGEVTGDGKIVFETDVSGKEESRAVDLPLDVILGSLPKKKFELSLHTPKYGLVTYPTDMLIPELLNAVIGQTSLSSKRWLTNKVDRSVTGLVAQQQCVGPFHVPIADVAVIALSYFDTVGSATSIGEQPLKILSDPGAGARMSVAEMLTNLAAAPISSIKDIKCSGNWMWPAKIINEGANLVAACRAMCETMQLLGIALDGGKDSLSMAAKDRHGETVLSPGSLVVSGYAPCVEIRKIVTPDLKLPFRDGAGKLILVRPCKTSETELRWRLGGSAFAQCFLQVGSDPPDLDHPELLVDAFNAIQHLIKGARMSVAEMLTNLAAAPISSIKDIKCSGNWMWPAKIINEGANLVAACRAMCETMQLLGIALDGGKDSLSMAAKDRHGETVLSPGSLVVSGYAPCVEIRKIVTPDLKLPFRDGAGKLILVRPCKTSETELRWRLGGSAFAQCFLQVGSDPPDLDHPELLVDAFNAIQHLIKAGAIEAIHDISDGGLIICLLEMAFGGYCGIDVNITHEVLGHTDGLVNCLFGEEAGWVIEVAEAFVDVVLSTFSKVGVFAVVLGTSKDFGASSQIVIREMDEPVFDEKMTVLFSAWEKTSFELELLQATPDCVKQEFASIDARVKPVVLESLPAFELSAENLLPIVREPDFVGIRVCVLREEGCNGDREMAAALHLAGFEVWDVMMSDLIDGRVVLDQFRGIIFPGGFSYADVLGSAKGWAASLTFHSNIKQQVLAWKSRPDTFSLGVCNGCQLMTLVGWLFNMDLENAETEPTQFPIHLDHNDSGRYESRFSWVKVMATNSVFFTGLAEACLGVWVAHGEGKFVFRDQNVLRGLEEDGCVAMVYTDDSGERTMDYPFNPNGSGVAAITSKDGRHLAMMPHPERCVHWWQWPFVPSKPTGDFSPWMQFFVNAYEWCNS